MPDQPDVPQTEAGVRQPSNRIALDVHLNEKFVEVVGAQKAQALVDLLNRMVEEHTGESVSEVAEQLRGHLGGIGVRMSDVEVDSFADQIVRAERALGADEPNPTQVSPTDR